MKNENTSSMPQNDFGSRFNIMRKELMEIDAKLTELQAAKATIYLQAAVSKLQRLEKTFGITSSKLVSDLNNAFAKLKAGDDIKTVEQDVSKILNEIESLRKDRVEKTKAELDSLLNKLKKLNNKPPFIRRLIGWRIRRLAMNADLHISVLAGLYAEKDLRIEGSDLKMLKYLEKNIDDMQKSADRIKQELMVLHKQEVERIERSIAGNMKIIEANDNSPGGKAKKAKTLFELKINIAMLEKLKKIEGY